MRIYLLLILLLPLLAGAEPKSLRAAVDEWPPYEFKAQHDIQGLSVEIVRQVLKQLGHDLQFVEDPVPWSRALAMLESGSIDLTFSGLRTAEREQFAHFPDESLLESHWVLFARTEQLDRYRSLKELTGGVRIGLVHGFDYPPALQQQFRAGAKPQVSYDSAASMRNLQQLRADLVAEELATGLHLIKTLGLQGQIGATAIPPFRREGLYVLFARKTTSKAFASRFSKALRAFKGSAQYASLLKQYGLTPDALIKLAN